MVVWLKHGPCTLGLEQGLVRAQDYAQLVTLADAVATTTAELETLLAQARDKASDILNQARIEATAIQNQAAELREKAYAVGLARGRLEARDEWTARAVDEAMEARTALERQKERLRDIVAGAVERVVGQTDRKALFAHALQSLSHLIDEVPMLTLRVHEADHDVAKSAVADLLATLKNAPPRVEIVCDAKMLQGSCLFESDRGLIDAGLETQLASLRRALAKVARPRSRSAAQTPSSNATNS